VISERMMTRRGLLHVLLLPLCLGCLPGCGGNSEEGVKHTEKLPPGRVPEMKRKREEQRPKRS
jgi:hypothetical protein